MGLSLGRAGLGLEGPDGWSLVPVTSLGRARLGLGLQAEESRIQNLKLLHNVLSGKMFCL